MNQEQFYRIEAYLRGEMPASEKAAFEAELAADPVLAEQLAAQQVQRKVAEIFIEDDLRAEVKKWREDLEDEPAQQPAPRKTVRLRWWVIIGVAASLLVLLLYFFLKTEEPPPLPSDELQIVPTEKSESPLQADIPLPDTFPVEKPKPASPEKRKPLRLSPYLALAKPYQAEPEFAKANFRNTDEAGRQRFSAAMALLSQKTYKPAIDSLLKFKPSDELYSDVQYNIGCAYYAWQKYESAIPYLQEVAENENSLYAATARWYLAVSLVATEKRAEEGDAYLAEVLKSPPTDEIREKAKKLRTELYALQKRSLPEEETEDVRIAQADYSRNPSMDAYADSRSRSEEAIKITMTTPLNDANFIPDTAGWVALRFVGTIGGAVINTPTTYSLSVFNNRDTKKPLFSASLTPQKDAAGALHFNHEERRKLPRGLYYFTLVERGTYTGRFTVGKQ